jgi:hypothetical protein
MGFLPPPTFRVYSFSCDLSGFGIKGATMAQNLFDTSQDFVFIRFSFLGRKYAENLENV